jgi:hypothetical protein
MAYLALQIGPAIAGGLADFFFYRAFMFIAVWMFLFWHRA